MKYVNKLTPAGVTPSIKPFPKLMKRVDPTNRTFYVSFEKPEKGTVQWSDSKDYPVGYRSESWNMSCFLDTNDVIKLNVLVTG